MADYQINKGIGRSVEFKELRAQYLFVFAGGLLAVFLLVVVLYMAGAAQIACIGLGSRSACGARFTSTTSTASTG